MGCWNVSEEQLTHRCPNNLMATMPVLKLGESNANQNTMRPFIEVQLWPHLCMHQERRLAHQEVISTTSTTYLATEAHLGRVDEHVESDAGRLPLHRLDRPEFVVEGGEDTSELGHPHTLHATAGGRIRG